MIKQISYFVTGILSLSLLGCVEETRATEKIKIDSKYYPKGFETELQSNLDFFMDGVGVSPSVKVPYFHRSQE